MWIFFMRDYEQKVIKHNTLELIINSNELKGTRKF